MPKSFFVYMMTNFRHGSIYTGVTSNLPARVWQHRNHAFKGSFTDRYDLTVLCWYEAHGSPEAAIEREKQLKDWHRNWKVELIEAANPRWNDLWDDIVQ